MANNNVNFFTSLIGFRGNTIEDVIKDYAEDDQWCYDGLHPALLPMHKQLFLNCLFSMEGDEKLRMIESIKWCLDGWRLDGNEDRPLEDGCPFIIDGLRRFIS
jgi:hypothetical protein